MIKTKPKNPETPTSFFRKLPKDSFELPNSIPIEVLEESPLPFSVCDAEGNYITCNKAFCDLTGFTLEELVQTSWVAITPPEYLTKEISLAYELVITGTPQRVEKEYFRKDGTRVPVELIIHRHFQPAAKTCFDFTFVINIENLRKMTDNVHDVITETTPEGIITYLSPSLHKILGYDPDKVVGMHLFDLVHPDDIERLSIAFSSFLSGRTPAKTDFRCRHINGYYLWMETVGNLLYDQNNIISGAVLSTRDITRRKELEKTMAHLEQINLVGEVAVGLGHEIRNPLTTVRGFLQLMQKDDNFNSCRDRINLMLEELDRANRIIKKFLFLAKDKALHLKVQNLNTIIQSVYPAIKTTAKQSGLRVKTDLGITPDLMLDESEIILLLKNLSLNGLEAMAPGGTLLIRTYIESRSVVLSISDQGTGIPGDVVGKVGTPFFTTRENGTGLGMAICYRIAARHNASVKIETGPSGTTVFVNFET